MAYIGKRPVDTFPANNAVTSSIISENAVGSSEIATNAVTTLQIADNAITSAKIVNGTIVSGDIAANTIATSNIADNAVDSTKIAQNSILTKHIDDGQVTTDQLGADAVTAAKLADDSVVTANIVDSNVTTAKIADDAVTLAKMAGLSRGKIIVGDSSGNPSALALGSSGQVLKSDGSDLVFAADSGLSTEEVQDIVGAMFSSNTETNITATYQDSDGTIDLVVADSTSTEDVQDIVGGQLVTNGSHTNLTAAYDDAGDGAVDLTVQQQLNNTSAPYYHKITVTVVSDSGNKYALDGGTQAIAKLTPSVVYRFDQSDSSNSSHPLRIGTAANGSEISSGYTIYNKVGTPGNAGAYTEIALEQDAPTLLYYWCSAHSGMGAQIAVADESALTQTLTNKTLTSPNITGLSLAGTAVTSTAAELNILDGVTSTTAELNILDGVTSTAAELNILDGVTSTAAELNILDGVTSTAAELNILDGVTSTTAELNILDGVTTTAAELNIMDGDTAAISTTLANADRVVINDNGTMKQVALSDLATYMGDNVTINQTQTALTVSGNTTIGGNLTVNGTTTTLNTTNSVISDRLIELGNGTTGSPANDMGIVMERGDSANAFMGFDESADKFIVGTGTFTGASTGDLTITTGTLVANLEGAVTGNASTATALANARTIHGVSFDGTANIDLSEVVQDTVGAMFSSNTETGITATYQDSDGTIDLVVGTLNQDTTGNAATATALETARTIHGVSFDGSANIDLSEVVQDTVGAMFSSNTETGITATYEDSDGTIDLVVGTLNQDTTGSAATLTTARTIGGVSFDGSANIDLPGVNSAGNQNTTGSAATLTNGRTIGMTGDVVWTSASFDGSGNVTGSATIQADAVEQSMIADDAVGADQLAANSVVSASIVNGSIVSADIAANTIATSNVADNAINATKIASNSILTRHIDDNQVTGDQISDDVVLSGTGAVTLPKGTTAQRPSGTAGEFRFNTTTSKFEGHNGSEFGEIGGGGSNGFLTDIFDGTTTPATDGSRVAFTMSQSVTDEKFVMVFIDGVYQAHDAYSVSGATLTMADAPVAGRVLTVHSISAAVQGDGLNVDNFSGDGSDTTFTLSLNPVHENNTQVYIDGVYQFKNTYAVSGTTLTFSSAPPNGSSIEVMTHSQTTVNSAASLSATAISSLSQVTAVAADHLLLFDATDSALKKCLFSDALETATSISTSADAVALTFDSSENATFAGTISLADNKTISFGASADLGIKHDGSNSKIENNTGDLYIINEADDKDIIFQGDDGGGNLITALTLDMSEAGAATFNSTVNGLTLGAGSIATSTSQNFALNTPNSLRINIDSNDSATDQVFVIGKNQTGVDASNDVLFKIGEDGKAGIGIGSPNATLHVGSSNAVGDATNPAIQIGGTSTYRGGMYTTSEGFIIDNNNGDDGISFFTKTAGEMMQLRADGIVHITSAGAPIAPTIKHGQTDVAKLRLINRSGQGANKGGVLELGAVTDDGVTRSDVFASLHGGKDNATSGNKAGYLDFATSAGSSVDQRMRLTSNGELLIGDTSLRGTNQRGQLQVTQISGSNAAGVSAISGNDEIAGTFCLYSSSTASAMVSVDPDSARGSSAFYIWIDGSQKAVLDSSGNLTISGSLSQSDRALKENITTLPSQLENVKKLNPVSFDWKEKAEDGSTQSSIGFVAQEVEELYPNLVKTPPTDTDAEEGSTTQYKTLNYPVMVSILTKALQEADAKIEALTARVTTLEG